MNKQSCLLTTTNNVQKYETLVSEFSWRKKEVVRKKWRRPEMNLNQREWFLSNKLMLEERGDIDRGCRKVLGWCENQQGNFNMGGTESTQN